MTQIQFTIIAMPWIQCRHRINSIHTLFTSATQDCCHVCLVFAGQMETLFSNFKTLLTKKGYYVTQLPYLLALSTLHNRGIWMWSVLSQTNIYNRTCE